ncbi:1-phosphofructokinase family hexose kinase [Streptomyces sp. ODS28]|uniref:1-phosphofructokinase family hexose kinase n=1 Tax=Streptomyces sp. ODS28 TaxID=3136688 RepID=UPI0031E9E596
MILTVTLNSALDLTYRVAGLAVHGSNRVEEASERPGGKGLNVARVLAGLGHDAVVTGLVGGGTGAALRAMLAAEGSVTDALVSVDGATRRTVGVVDTATGDTTQLNEPGPHVTSHEWEALLERYADLLPGADAVALCGSLPPGVPVGAYARLVRDARDAGVPVLLDTSGEPLRRGLAARPDVVKPNAEELAGVTGITGSTAPLRAARAAQRRGARAVVASLGAQGLIAVTQEGSWRAVPPESLSGNPTGAGDSAVAGLLSGLVEDLPWPDRLARAVALSAATVRAPAAGEFDPETYDAVLPRVKVNEQLP